MKAQSILIIGLVWPEPGSSAAGSRMIQLIKLFNPFYEVIFACAATKGPYSFDLGTLDVRTHEIKLNDESFNELLKKLQPAVVLFDRFVMEEQYGWRVDQECPCSLKILDTEDLHTLRDARRQSLKDNKDADMYSDLAKREMASVLRCDLSLIISAAEMEILKNTYRIDSSLFCYLPFIEEKIRMEAIEQWKKFEEREGFVFIGNFLHEPNWQAVQYIKNTIWPLLRKRVPGAACHIYGAYAGQKVIQLQQKKEQFFVHGRADDALQAIERHRVLIAPLQFGAGLKGKFIDAMRSGTPSVTTTLGAEGMTGTMPWPGAMEDEAEAFADQAAAIYHDKSRWIKAQGDGVAIINQRFERSLFEDDFIKHVDTMTKALEAHRRHNFMGQILRHHTMNSLKYMSLWIAEKNRKD